MGHTRRRRYNLKSKRNIEIDAIELDKEYYDKSVQRVKDFAAQLTMF